MKISELIAKLEKFKDEYGDLNVYYPDVDYGLTYIERVDKDFDEEEEYAILY